MKTYTLIFMDLTPQLIVREKVDVDDIREILTTYDVDRDYVLIDGGEVVTSKVLI